MIGYTPLPAGQSGGITGTLGVNAWSAGAAQYTGALDALVAQGATVLRAFSVRRILGTYGGKCCGMRANGLGSPEADIAFVDDSLDRTAVASLIATGGGNAAFFKTWYDQVAGMNAVQATAAQQPGYSESSFATGAMGVGAASQNFNWLDMNLGTLALPFAVFAVVRKTGTSALFLIGHSTTTANRYVSATSITNRPVHNWGGATVSNTTAFTTGKDTCLWVNAGAGSKIVLNGASSATADPGGSQLDMATGRLGCASVGGTAWLAAANNAVAELIIFSCDPTGLAGWAAFLAATKSYYGTT